MDADQVKQQFIARLPQNTIGRLPPIYLGLIDEAIEGIISGTTIINGKTPETEDEIFIAIGMHFSTGTTALEAMMMGARQAHSKDAVNIKINYRGETQEFYFDSLE